MRGRSRPAANNAPEMEPMDITDINRPYCAESPWKVVAGMVEIDQGTEVQTEGADQKHHQQQRLEVRPACT